MTLPCPSRSPLGNGVSPELRRIRTVVAAEDGSSRHCGEDPESDSPALGLPGAGSNAPRPPSAPRAVCMRSASNRATTRPSTSSSTLPAPPREASGKGIPLRGVPPIYPKLRDRDWLQPYVEQRIEVSNIAAELGCRPDTPCAWRWWPPASRAPVRLVLDVADSAPWPTRIGCAANTSASMRPCRSSPVRSDAASVPCARRWPRRRCPSGRRSPTGDSAIRHPLAVPARWSLVDQRPQACAEHCAM